MNKPSCLSNMTEEQVLEFEELYQRYWSYIYKYELQDLTAWNPDTPWYKRNDFVEQLQEEARTIKVREGY